MTIVDTCNACNKPCILYSSITQLFCGHVYHFDCVQSMPPDLDSGKYDTDLIECSVQSCKQTVSRSKSPMIYNVVDAPPMYGQKHQLDDEKESNGLPIKNDSGTESIQDRCDSCENPYLNINKARKTLSDVMSELLKVNNTVNELENLRKQVTEAQEERDSLIQQNQAMNRNVMKLTDKNEHLENQRDSWKSDKKLLEKELDHVKKTQRGVQSSIKKFKAENIELKKHMTNNTSKKKKNDLKNTKPPDPPKLNLEYLIKTCSIKLSATVDDTYDKHGQWKDPPDLEKILSTADLLDLVDSLKTNDDISLDGSMSAATCSILRAVFTDSRMASAIGKVQRAQLFGKIFPTKGAFHELVFSRFGSKLIELFFLDKKQNVDGEHFEKMMSCFAKGPEKFAFDKNASYALQQGIKEGSDDQVRNIFSKLFESDIVKLCTNSYATRVIQMLFENERFEKFTFRVDIADKLRHKFAEVATDERGMYVTNGLFKTFSNQQIRITMKHVLNDEIQMKELRICKLGKMFIGKLKKNINY